MTGQDNAPNFELSRRRLLAAAGIAPGVAIAVSVIGVQTAEAAPAASQAAARVPAPPVAVLHLQFGADAAAEIVVSWHTLQAVTGARVLLGRPDGKLEQTVEARQASYTDGKSKQVVVAHHATVTKLEADTEYMYAALHDGAAPEFGTFRTAARGRFAFTFTSFADQGTPTAGKKFVPPAGVTLPGPLFVNDNLGSPFGADTTLGVEHVRPLFHLFNGDLCYANLAQDRVRTWWDFWENNTRSARNRPWMPCPGNHENELGNGPIGFGAYQTYFSLPEVGAPEVARNLWYTFTAGSVRVISINNDDVIYQDAGDVYVRGYSNGVQKTWLEKELKAARADKAIDWVVICMHAVAISTVDKFNGADLGIRQEWLPLFDQYGVDLVVCGHEHHYERTHPLRGAQANETLTPIHVSTRTDVVDTSKGTVHMILGGAGTSVPSNELFFNPPQCRVIVSVSPERDPVTKHRVPHYVTENAPWSAVRNGTHGYGFASFAVDPGTKESGITSIKVEYYDVVGIDGKLSLFETFTLQRPRRDAV